MQALFSKVPCGADDMRAMKFRFSHFSIGNLAPGAATNGFTLVELLVTLSVATILVTMAVPSFSEFVKNNRMITQTNELVTTLNMARSEAVRRGTQITLCKSATGSSCTTSGGWEQGWIMFVDAAGSGTVANTSNILRVQSALASSVTLRGGTNFASYVSFRSTGATQTIGTAAAAPLAGVLVMCDDRGFGANSRAIQISTIGRVSSTAGNGSGSSASSCTPA